MAAYGVDRSFDSFDASRSANASGLSPAALSSFFVRFFVFFSLLFPFWRPSKMALLLLVTDGCNLWCVAIDSCSAAVIFNDVDSSHQLLEMVFQRLSNYITCFFFNGKRL